MLIFILANLFSFAIFVTFLLLAIEAKLDWTKDKELLLWYTEYEKGVKVRKFITLFKL